MTSPMKMPSRPWPAWGFGILVADEPRPTAAVYRLAGDAEVARFLQRLTDTIHEPA